MERSVIPQPPAGDRRRHARHLRRSWDAFYRTLRFVARHVESVYSAYAAFLSIAFVGAAALVAFIGIAKVMLEGLFQPWDDWVLRWFAAHRGPLLTTIMLQATSLGSAAVLVMVVLIGAAFLWLTRHRHSAYLLIASALGAAILNIMLKDVFERPRPVVVPRLVTVVTSSFPSGHAMSAMAAYGAIALLVTRLEATRPARIFTWVLAAFVIGVIGASRLYLGVHYPSDILGGYAAGLAWVAFAASGMRALQYFGRQTPHIRTQERHLDGKPEVRA